MKRRSSKKRRLPTNLFASKSRKSSVTRSKRSSLVKDSTNLLASSLLVNTAGPPIWKESWRLKLSEMLPCPHIWSPRRPWKSIPITPSSKNSRPDPTRTRLTRPSRISSGYSSKPPSSLLVSPSMTPLLSLTESTEWLSLVSNWTTLTLMKKFPDLAKKLKRLKTPTTLWKMLIEQINKLFQINII